MLACHGRRKALPYTPGDCVKWPYTPLTLHTSCPRPPIYLYSNSRSHARQGSRGWRRSRPPRSYHLEKHSLNHRTGNNKESPAWYCCRLWAGEKFSSLGSRKVDSHPRLKSPPRNANISKAGWGRVSGGRTLWKTGSWKTHPCPPPQGHEMMPAPPLNSIWQYCGCFYFVYFF